MSPSFEPLQPDTSSSLRRRINCIADTRTIALIASKRNFDPDKERILIKNATHCRHFTGSEPCLYRNCRHFADTHYKQNGVIIGMLGVDQ